MNPFRRQLPVWSPISLRAIAAGLGGRRDESGLRRLRDSLRREYEARLAVLTASGTVALSAALGASAAASARPRVALPAYACYDLATAADSADAIVRLYDVDPATLNPDLESFRAALDAGVDAAVLVHLFGVPVDPSFFALARDRGVLTIDDAAQGIGGSVAGRKLGSLGDLGILSFGRGKGRTGGGGGALLVTSGPGLSVGSKAESEIGAAPPAGRATFALLAQWMLGRPGLYQIPASLPFLRLGETIYHRPEPLLAMTPAAARIVGAVSSLAEAECVRRHRSGDRWMADVAGIPGVEAVRVPPAARPGWLRFPVLVERARSPAADARLKRVGVMPAYPAPLAELPEFRRRIEPMGAWPGARTLASRLLTLPTHSLVRESERRAILDLLRTPTQP